MKNTNSLLCISPLDGRYYNLTNSLSSYFSEYALIKKRIEVEVKYLRELSRHKVIRAFSQKEKAFFDEFIKNISLQDAEAVKKHEEKYKHDIKAMEYFLREQFDKTSIKDVVQYIHFGLTSEDINNLSYALLLREANREILIRIQNILAHLKQLSLRNKNMPLLALTHGQPAVPTTFGKEMAVFYDRIAKISKKIAAFHFEGKLNGAVGNFNALHFVFPKINWIDFSNNFVASLGLQPNMATNQILPSDNIAEYFDQVKLMNSILIDFCQDIWLYISREILVIKKEKNQVGSSAMPQKVNPIYFENAEGNLHVANALLELYSRKLPISRLQRDLTDSTIKRTFGTAIGHCVVAWENVAKGLGQIEVNQEAMQQELHNHMEILAEGLQVYLKTQGDQKGYETIQKLFQGKKVSQEEFHKVLKELHLDLKDFSLENYTGLAAKIVEKIIEN